MCFPSGASGNGTCDGWSYAPAVQTQGYTIHYCNKRVKCLCNKDCVMTDAERLIMIMRAMNDKTFGLRFYEKIVGGGLGSNG